MDFGPDYGNELSVQQQHVSRSRGWIWTCATMRGVSWRSLMVRAPFLRWFWVLVCFGLVRVGEASHPGPSGTWTFGVANPSGLNHKLDHIAHLEGDVWLMSETQLSQRGLSGFCKGLKTVKAPWNAVPGAPCPVRGSTETGSHSGVMMLSRFPARPLPHSFGEAYDSARLQVAGFVVGQVWVTAGILYGLPCNATHVQAKFQTDSLLAELVDRVACCGHGFRAIGGDFNYDTHELTQLKRLQEMGFREVQDLSAYRFGTSVLPTGRGKRRIDHLWISPELQQLFVGLQMRSDLWADHVAVEGVFAQIGASPTIDGWHMPQPFPWPAQWTCQVDFDVSVDSSVAYATMWHQLEGQAKWWVGQQGRVVSANQCGRGQTVTTAPRHVYTCPGKKARKGDVQPTFLGVSLSHARIFRQLRRLQSLHRLLQHGCDTWNACINRDDTWKAILAAAGFPSGFGLWWGDHGLQPSFGLCLPRVCPSVSEVGGMFDSFHAWVKQYEAGLAQSRYHHAKQRREYDLNFVFKDCKPDPLPKVDTLLDRVEGHIEEVREEDSSLVLVDPITMLPGAPVVVNGRAVDVLHHEADQVWVMSVDGILPGHTLVQEKPVCSDREILKRFAEVWEPRWQKLSHVAEGQWTQIAAFIERTFRPIKWEHKAWDVDRFCHAVSHKKKVAAKGPDGVSQPDLAALPKGGCEAHVKFFQSVEQGQAWPIQVATGFVTSLAKHLQAQAVDQFRPVTVYSLVYRLWSSERAKEALRSVAKVVPGSVQGGLPRRQAKAIWYEVAQALETAYVDNEPLHGIMLDLTKAFNMLPRFPLWVALRALDFPKGVLRAWVGFVSGQARRFRVRQSVGEGLQSCRGLPEGCALSVFGMVIVDWLLDEWLQQLSVSVDLQAFVDDWGVLFRDADTFHVVWRAILDFTQLMDLTLDMAKSKLWSTHAAARGQFRETALHVAYTARNLGAHQNFTRHCWNSVLQSRLKQMPEVWSRLRASLSPYRAKVRALAMLGWPRALHGISVVHLGHSHYKVLRTGAMRSLRAERKGANPVLHLSTNGMHVDPEGWTILQTLRDVRELGGYEKMERLLSLFASRDVDLPKNGPTAVLLTRLERLGCAVNTNGLVQDRFGSFNLLGLSWDELLLRVRMSWGVVLQQEVGHRASFQGIDMVDLGELQLSLRQFGQMDLVYLRCHLDGTLYTQNGRAKFESNTSDRCPWCGEKDGFYHRAWKCPHFADCRSHLTAEQLDLVPSLPLCLSAHGWPVMLPEWEVFSGWLLGGHGLKQLSSFELPKITHDRLVDVFVDGTAAHPKEAKLRYAAWAITCVPGGPGSLDNQVVAGGHVEGLIQSPYRAELTAMLEALRWATRQNVRVRIWCDCQGVCQGVRRLQRGGVVKVNGPHSDLWQEIAQLLADREKEDVVVCKVVSHGDYQQATSPLEEWVYWHNALTDHAVNKINELRPQGFWVAWNGLAKALEQHRKLHLAILFTLLKSGRKAHREQQVVPKVPVVPVRREVKMPVPPSCWTLSDKTVKRYGRGNAQAFHQWWTAVGNSMLQSEHQLVWISGVQLFAAFNLATAYVGPFVWRKRWYSVGDDIPDQARVSWGSRVKPFLLMMRSYLAQQGVKLCQKLTKPRSAAVSRWVVSYRLRWHDALVDQVDDALFHLKGRQLVTASDLADLRPPRTG